MLNSKAFDDLAARIGKAIEDSPAKDIEKNVKAMLAAGLARLDLVPRAEFDMQAQVLLKTREKLEALEARARRTREARLAAAGKTPRTSACAARTRRPPRSSPDCVSARRARRCRSPSSSRAPSPASTRRSSRSRCISPAACRHSISSACRTPRCKESRDRVRAALQNAQFEFPARKITVNLAPADLPKESGRFDLPIALGILAATGQIPAHALAAL